MADNIVYNDKYMLSISRQTVYEIDKSKGRPTFRCVATISREAGVGARSMLILKDGGRIPPLLKVEMLNYYYQALGVVA